MSRTTATPAKGAAADEFGRPCLVAAVDLMEKVEWLDVDLAPEDAWWRTLINQPQLMPDGDG
jgi:hypothetical protein